MDLNIFISYAREDIELSDRVKEVIQSLGINFFRDLEGLTGGEDWNRHILQIARESNFFVFLASASSIGKSGMIAEELEIARAKLTLNEDFTFFAVRLDDTPLPNWMTKLQYVNLEDPYCFEKLISSLNARFDNKDEPIRSVGGNAFVNLHPPSVRYETTSCDYEYTVPSFATLREPHLDRELNSLLRGKVSERILTMRGYVEPGPPTFPEVKNIIVVEPIDVLHSSRAIGFLFEHFAHFSGAAHPQHHFFTLNIRRSPWALMTPRILDESKQDFVHLIVDQLEQSEGLWDEGDLREDLFDFEFADHMIVGDASITIAFPDYVIAPYAHGTSLVKFEDPRLFELVDLDN
ncbi:MAG: TIR domain-containing protein [Pseudomonadota bacterium]